MRTVISDTSPLFYLAKIGRVELLRVLHKVVIVPETVWSEAMACAPSHPEVASSLGFAKAEGWLQVADDKNLALDFELRGLDDGEAHAIALAARLQADLIIIDEAEGRKVAERRGFSITGTVGILLKGRQLGLITSIRSDIGRLIGTGFRISQSLADEIVRLAGE